MLVERFEEVGRDAPLRQDDDHTLSDARHDHHRARDYRALTVIGARSWQESVIRKCAGAVEEIESRRTRIDLEFCQYGHRVAGN